MKPYFRNYRKIGSTLGIGSWVCKVIMTGVAKEILLTNLYVEESWWGRTII
jgi:hypothetical protein